MLNVLVQNNYHTFVVILLMVFFLWTNRLFDRKKSKVFAFITGVILVVVIAEMVGFTQAMLDKPTKLRVIASIVGYSLRPVIAASILWMIVRKWYRNYIMIIVPTVLNILIQCSALFCGIAFSYNEANEFVRGPLGYSAHIVSLYYLVLLIIATFRKYRNLTLAEPFLAVFASVLTLISTGLEHWFELYGILTSTASVSVVFYYMYLNTQQFKRDGLTNALNRKCFMVDSVAKFDDMTALISIDLNNLKQINDTYGHEEGDKAIITVSECIRKSLIKGCFLYRVGGDEFQVLCIQKKENELYQMMDSISRRLEPTPYSCAMGVALKKDVASFEELCEIADKKMYENKKKLRKN